MFVVGRLFILSCSLKLGMAKQLKRKASQRRLSLRTRQKITGASKRTIEREAKTDEPESLSDEIVEADIDDSLKDLTEQTKVKEKKPDKVNDIE